MGKLVSLLLHSYLSVTNIKNLHDLAIHTCFAIAVFIASRLCVAVSGSTIEILPKIQKLLARNNRRAWTHQPHLYSLSQVARCHETTS